MKLLRHSDAANTLLVTLVICTILGTSTIGYLTLVEEQNKLGVRSQDWNFSMAMVEAGIEDGMQELNTNTNNATAAYNDGWTPIESAVYRRTQTLGNGSYTVTVDAENLKDAVVTAVADVNLPSLAMNYQPAFLAAVGVPASATIVRRAVRVHASRGYLFTHAMVAQSVINLNGHNVLFASFDSAVGPYDPNNPGSEADVMSDTNIINSVSGGNATIYGHVTVGPGGTVYTGPKGYIGSYSYQQSGGTGTQSGWVTDTANYTFPDVYMPDTTGWLTSPTVINGTNYLTGGNYDLSSLSGPTVVTGPVTLALPNGFSQTSGDSLTVASGGSIQIYAGSTSASFSGKTVVNETGLAANFILWCTETVTSVSYSGNANFTGVLVAPYADIFMNGGGSTTVYDFTGAIIAGSVQMNGNFNFYYDTQLKNLAWNKRYLVTSWNEITPP